MFKSRRGFVIHRVHLLAYNDPVPTKVKIRSIDNYQGEENEIIVASMTRSNSKGDIGFMSEKQRLNVLLSRARRGLIIVGNFETFQKSRKGGPTYTRLLELAKDNIHEGVPIECPRHPDKKGLIHRRQDFEEKCPDGGCTEPWYGDRLTLM